MTRYGPLNSLDAELLSASDHLTRSIQASSLTRLRSGCPSGPAGPDGGAGLRAADLTSIQDFVETLRRVVFPGFFDPEPVPDEQLAGHIRGLVSAAAALLHEEVTGVLRYPQRTGEKSPQLGDFAREVVKAFFERLVHVRDLIGLDVQAAYDGDPAAEHTDEVILCYPGMDAVFAHRIAHELYLMGVPLLPRLIAEQAHSRTGIDIHPGAKIGESFFVDHGSGTVIGETSVIGKLVKIYQGVTLGARSFPKDERGRAIRGIKRHPTIGDRVNIYAGAVILGGDTVIGDDCVIAGGVFVTSSVPPGHVVQQHRAELTLRPNSAVKPRTSAGPTQAAPPPTPRPSPPKAAAAADEPAAANIDWLGDGAGI
jgi:serine O-acetyltransferase